MASEKHTVVRYAGPGPIMGGGYAVRGAVTREEAVREARAHYEHQRAEAERFLSAPDADVDVRIVRGVYRQTLVEILPPGEAQQAAKDGAA